MVLFSTLRSCGALTKRFSSVLKLNSVPVKDVAVRHMSEHRTMGIVPSKFQYSKFKDLLHFYILLGFIPLGALMMYVNIFIGPATLTELPSDRRPEHWEYYKHPITRFIARYIHTSPQQEYEKFLHWLYEADERAKMGLLDNKVKALMMDRSDYQAFYYFPVDAKYARLVRDEAENLRNYDGDK